MTLRFVCALVAVYLTFASAAFPPALSRFTGRWELLAADSEDVDKAIDATVAPMSFVARPIARIKLKRRNVAFPRFTITQSPSGVRVAHEQGLNVLYPSAGTAVKTHATDGADVETRLVAEPELLLLSYDTAEGRREDRYTLSADGSVLTLNVRLTSPKLPKPLVYKLVYRHSRVAGG